MTNEIATELGPLLAQAHILMFEYDVDGFLMSAQGSCLGGADPQSALRAGCVSPAAERRAAAGARVVDSARIGARAIAVVHEPVRNERGQIERIVATALDVTERSTTAEPSARWLELLPAS